MPIAGKIIVIHSKESEQATQIALAIRATEKHKAYFHVGNATLTGHFLPQKLLEQQQDYRLALYGAISGTARCGADVVADFSNMSAEDYHGFMAFVNDLEVVWVNIDINPTFVSAQLQLSNGLSVDQAAKAVLDYLATRYRYVEAYARWAEEVSPVSVVSKPGKIVLLTGASSAGKSTLSRAIQQASDEVFLHVGIDTAVVHYLHLRYLSGVPEYEGDERWREPNFEPSLHHQQGSSWIAPGPNGFNPHGQIRYQVGTEARRAISAMYATMAEMSRLGFNVISDHCFHFPNSIAEAKHRFKHLPVYYIDLCPDPEIIQAREQQRGDRMKGMGMAVYHQMLHDYDADLHLDTGRYRPEEGARQVLALLAESKP